MPGTHHHVILNFADPVTWLCDVFFVKGELQKISPEQAVETLVEYPSEDETIGRSTRTFVPYYTQTSGNFFFF